MPFRGFTWYVYVSNCCDFYVIIYSSPLRLYSFSLCAFTPFSRIVTPFFGILFTLFLSRLPFWGPYTRILLQRLPLPYCHASLDRPPFPASYNSLILSTCRSQTSMIPSIRPWARDYSPKVLFSACVLHPHSSDLAEFSCRFVLPLYLVEPTPISCPTPPLLNDDEGRRNCTPSCPKLLPSSSQPKQRPYLQIRQIQVCCESQVLLTIAAVGLTRLVCDQVRDRQLSWVQPSWVKGPLKTWNEDVFPFYNTRPD